MKSIKVLKPRTIFLISWVVLSFIQSLLIWWSSPESMEASERGVLITLTVLGTLAGSAIGTLGGLALAKVSGAKRLKIR